MASTVYITQIPQRKVAYDHYVPALETDMFLEFGDKVVDILPARTKLYPTEDLVEKLRVGFMPYNYAAGDSVILHGAWDIIAASAAILGKYHKGKYNLIRLDKLQGRYKLIKIEV